MTQQRLDFGHFSFHSMEDTSFTDKVLRQIVIMAQTDFLPFGGLIIMDHHNMCNKSPRNILYKIATINAQRINTHTRKHTHTHTHTNKLNEQRTASRTNELKKKLYIFIMIRATLQLLRASQQGDRVPPTRPSLNN